MKNYTFVYIKKGQDYKAIVFYKWMIYCAIAVVRALVHVCSDNSMMYESIWMGLGALKARWKRAFNESKIIQIDWQILAGDDFQNWEICRISGKPMKINEKPTIMTVIAQYSSRLKKSIATWSQLHFASGFLKKD